MSYVHSVCRDRYQHLVLMKSARTIEKAEIQCFWPFLERFNTLIDILDTSSAQLQKLCDISYIK